jgi:hypothetical protein
MLELATATDGLVLVREVDGEHLRSAGHQRWFASYDSEPLLSRENGAVTQLWSWSLWKQNPVNRQPLNESMTVVQVRIVMDPLAIVKGPGQQPESTITPTATGLQRICSLLRLF